MASNRVSGIQREVYALYRTVLREASKKDREAFSSSNRFGSLLSPEKGSKTSTSYAASEFRKQAAGVKRSEFKKIEYMIRKCEKQVKLLSMPGVKVVGGTSS